MTNDPLAGYREEINSGERIVLTWRDTGTGCPVEIDQVFALRNCAIQIQSIKRNGRGQVWHWVATFERFERHDRVHLLAAGAGDGRGYTPNSEQALRSGEEFNANPSRAELEAALAAPIEDLRYPPEPEAVPPHEVKNLPSTIAARARYEQERRADIERRLDRSIAAQLKEVRVRARASGVDVSEEMAEIVSLADRAMAKVKRAA